MNSKKVSLKKWSGKFTKALLIALTAILSTSVLTTFVFSNDETTITGQTSEDGTVSINLIDYPKEYSSYRAPLTIFNDSIAQTIAQHPTTYQDSYREYIITTYPEVDIKKLDDFVSTINGYNADLKSEFETFQTIYDNQGYVDAYLLSEELTASYNYNSSKYNYIASFINTYGDEYNQEINDFIVSFLDDSVYYVGFMGYLDLGYTIGNDYENQKAIISSAYDEVYQQVSYLSDDPDERNKVVADIIQDSVMDWVYEVDIDYFKAYQAQVRLYLQNTKELGYVYDTDNNVIDYSWNVVNSREIILGDFLADPYIGGSLSPEFLSANLNADGTDFISPEEVYETPFIQTIIQQSVKDIITPSDSTDTAFYEKENYVESTYNAIIGQYYAMSMPGAYSQPILQAYNWHFVYKARDEYYSEHQKLPELTTWIPEGQTITEYDQYRLLNYIKLPSIDLEKESIETVTRTVHYVFEDGTIASPDVVQSANFNVVKELISGREIVDSESQILASIENPTVDYVQSDVTVLQPNESVKEVEVTRNSTNEEITIVYPLEFTLNVIYVDEEGTQITESDSISGRWNTQYDVTAIEIEGYELVQVPTNASGVFGDNREQITFVYKKVIKQDLEKPDDKIDVKPTPDESESDSSSSKESETDSSKPTVSTPGTSSTINAADSPKTGDATMATTWMILIGSSIILVTYVISRKRKSEK
ncbi:MucBP domain-containing protein [Breznakia pachnodae]|uniref:LPXTG cell wall anchor domain-containing protein n=1 Tax=Breznakia pachnodae TaxID=265178 RepID=A0ABU0E3H9_9FIRM|nr:MucBP domain-containing protein [Breznakia pachnodae]MDQ0361457.1 hypothetical protein [Breznakia pachnodae]